MACPVAWYRAGRGPTDHPGAGHLPEKAAFRIICPGSPEGGMAGSTDMSEMALAAARRYARLNGIPLEMAWRYVADHFGKPPKPKSMLFG